MILLYKELCKLCMINIISLNWLYHCSVNVNNLKSFFWKDWSRRLWVTPYRILPSGDNRFRLLGPGPPNYWRQFLWNHLACGPQGQQFAELAQWWRQVQEHFPHGSRLDHVGHSQGSHWCKWMNTNHDRLRLTTRATYTVACMCAMKTRPHWHALATPVSIWSGN